MRRAAADRDALAHAYESMRHSGVVTTNNVNLVEAEANGVLGEYDHRLLLPSAEDFAIIYGPNGVGKTKFLEIIHAMIDLDGRALTALPFHDASLVFSDGTELHVEPTDKEPAASSDRRRGRRQLEFTIRRRGRQPATWNYTGETAADWLLENTSWRPFKGDIWEDFQDGEMLPLQEIEERFPHISDGSEPLPSMFRGFRRAVKSYLIETQRLHIEDVIERPRIGGFRQPRRRRPTSKITQHANKMRSLLTDAQTEHSTITQQLDRTFPNRVLERSTNSADAKRVRSRYEEQNAFRSRLGRVASVDLEEALSLPDRRLDDWEIRLLTQYLDDTEKKLVPFEKLIQKIELFEEIINTRLLRKKLRVTAKEGLLVVHHSDTRSIGLDSLSSGEQHEIILMFDLLFNVPEGALVMIDEPEISLHVVWQLTFIPDVQKIAALAGFRFIVATHSPQIINDAWDRAVPLGPEEIPFT